MPTLGKTLDIDRCPHCRVHMPQLYTVWGAQTSGHSGKRSRFWKAYECHTCGGIVIAVASADGQGIIGIFPTPDAALLSESIPQRAREYLRQAIDSGNQPSGAVMLAASAVDAMLKAKNYKDGSLYARIEKAAKDHLITTDMAEWAHDVRLDANDERHVDEAAALPNSQDAERCIDFALGLAEFVFVLPERVRRGRAKPGTP